jgi:hypothetical protein
MTTPSTINQDTFDKSYTDALDRLVMGGLSIQLAIPAALTLNTGINTKPHTAANPTKSNTGYNPCPTPAQSNAVN